CLSLCTCGRFNIMPKRPRADSSSVTSVAIKSLFEELFAIANASKPADSATLRILRKLKDQALSAKVEKESIRKAAKEFTLDEAVLDFGLTYSSSLKDAAKHLWKIEMMPEFKTLEPSASLAQLVVYLACLRQSRVNRGRSNTSVYGVATYGLSYIFLIITQEGVLKLSRLFNVMQEDLSTVLGSLRYILEMAMSMTPNVTPEKGALMESDELEDDDPIGDPIDLDDNPYLHSDDEQ
ncbi:hypothetical protein F5887DRAFT_891341, partial [Amanita rubescens]